VIRNWFGTTPLSGGETILNRETPERENRYHNRNRYHINMPRARFRTTRNNSNGIRSKRVDFQRSAVETFRRYDLYDAKACVLQMLTELRVETSREFPGRLDKPGNHVFYVRNSRRATRPTRDEQC